MNKLGQQSKILLTAITIGLGFAVLGTGCTQGNDNAGSSSSPVGAATTSRPGMGNDHRLGTGTPTPPANPPANAETNGGMAAGTGNSNHPVSDTWITTKVKATLAATKGGDNGDIDVETNNGVVTLTGHVNSQQALDRVVTRIKTVEGVKDVDTSRVEVGGGTGH